MRQKGQEEGGDYRPVLSVATRLVDNTVEIRVRDNGPGIADDVVTHIFNPFFSTRYGALGAGLGLPFAADVARRLGGDLSVDGVWRVRRVQDDPTVYRECRLAVVVNRGQPVERRA